MPWGKPRASAGAVAVTVAAPTAATVANTANVFFLCVLHFAHAGQRKPRSVGCGRNPRSNLKFAGTKRKERSVRTALRFASLILAYGTGMPHAIEGRDTSRSPDPRSGSAARSRTHHRRQRQGPPGRTKRAECRCCTWRPYRRRSCRHNRSHKHSCRHNKTGRSRTRSPRLRSQHPSRCLRQPRQTAKASVTSVEAATTIATVFATLREFADCAQTAYCRERQSSHYRGRRNRCHRQHWPGRQPRGSPRPCGRLPHHVTPCGSAAACGRVCVHRQRHVPPWASCANTGVAIANESERAVAPKTPNLVISSPPGL